jgi:type I restriction-modification system DNA methylase subunit
LTSPQTERQQSVLNLLQGLKGQEPLKKLFWTELNYDKANSPLSRKGWGEQASSALADDPTLFATGGKDFHVIHSRLRSEKLLMGMERPVVSRLLQDHPYALFIFSNASQDQWHFLNVKYDDDVQKRRLFRRISVTPLDRLRTASERLDKINLADAPNVAPNTIQKLHDDAFDVEPVTKEFFHEYARIFDEVENAIKGIRDAERKRLFVQRLFNRLMFVAFIQKKGWLTLNGSKDYLTTLWKVYQHDNAVSDKNFYRDRLKPLFFFGLNSANEVNQIGINRGGFLKTLIGDVPYLNGGLFDEDDDDKDEKLVVPDKALDAVLNDLFSRFNFTVTESTPLDIEVAVDPEMLGKIFEELVTGRHETGSYYTPKPIVAFMCREALKGYLETHLFTEPKDAIEAFVDEHKPSKLHDAEAVLEALRRIKVCDPACGSGAYLVGMLHELLDLRASLFATAKLDAKSVYDRKLEIIQNNVYGVDLDEFAVNIARLRLWLSLSVDFEGSAPPPLPNLDYKVEVGDTICSQNPAGLQIGLRKSLVDDYLKAKAEYMRAHHGRKLELKNEITRLRADIASWAHRGASDFDWPIDFAEVFAENGFDVVLANPPYVRMELFKDIKPILRANFPHIHADRTDLYCYFYARSLEILRDRGVLVFISSNKWFRARYGAKLRKYISETCSIRSITDFGDLPVFESATAYPMIFIAQKTTSREKGVLFTKVTSLNPPYPDVLALIRTHGHQLPSSAVSGADWTVGDQSGVEFFTQIRGEGTPLLQYAQGQIFYGVKTGLNDAFVIDGKRRRELVTADGAPAARVIKSLITGRDIRKWKARNADRWLIYIGHDSDVRGLSAVLKHLKPYKSELENRATKQAWYELQQPQARYAAHFDKPKIVYPIITNEPRFALDTTGAYINDKVYAIPTDDLYLLGVLNSSAFWRVITALCSPLRGGFYELRVTQLANMPIPDATKIERSKIASLVERCLTLEDSDRVEIETEIDERIAKLYSREQPQAHPVAQET